MYPNTIKSLEIESVHPNKGGHVLQNVEKVLESSQRMQNWKTVTMFVIICKKVDKNCSSCTLPP